MAGFDVRGWASGVQVARGVAQTACNNMPLVKCLSRNKLLRIINKIRLQQPIAIEQANRQDTAV